MQDETDLEQALDDLKSSKINRITFELGVAKATGLGQKTIEMFFGALEDLGALAFLPDRIVYADQFPLEFRAHLKNVQAVQERDTKKKLRLSAEADRLARLACDTGRQWLANRWVELGLTTEQLQGLGAWVNEQQERGEIESTGDFLNRELTDLAFERESVTEFKAR